MKPPRDINYGIKPFWFWNGDMRVDEIRRQMREMAAAGVGGAMINPRQGLDIPYLSKTWFDRVAVVVEMAKDCNMEVWLYDEYPYPSGIAGGEVTLDHPEFEARNLECITIDFDGAGHLRKELPFGEIVTAAAYKVAGGKTAWGDAIDIAENIGICHMEDEFIKSGLTIYNAKRYFAAGSKMLLDLDLPAGRWHVMIFMQVPTRKMKFYDKFVDPLNPAAMAYFIECTHERYKKYLGHEFGKVIRGFFSDEIAPNDGVAQWSRLFPEIFEKANGYPLLPHLPALVESMGPADAKFRFDYANTMANAFFKSYDEQIMNWCRNNNMLYIGEKPILRSRQLKYMDIPGVDTGHHKCGAIPDILGAGNRGNPKMAASASHFYGKSRTLCEAFHSIGWGTTLKDMKWQYDYLSLFGINFFTPHAFYYTTDGLVKHDAPPSVFFQMPYWKHSRLLHDYLENLDRSLTEMNKQIRTLMVDPTCGTWTAIGEKAGLRARLGADYASVQKQLYMNHIDFYYVDTDLLDEAAAHGGKIALKGETFDLLVIPPMLCMEDLAVKAIEKFVQAGVQVIFCGCLPLEQIEGGAGKKMAGWFGNAAAGAYTAYVAGTNTAARLDAGSAHFIAAPAALPAAVIDLIGRDCSVAGPGSDGSTGEIKDILCSHYKNGQGHDFYFMTNIGGQKHDAAITLKTSQNSPAACELNLQDRNKCKKRIPSSTAGGHVRFNLAFDRYEAKMIAIKDGACEDCTKKGAPGELKIDLQAQWNFKPMNMNALRLDTWTLKVNGRPGPKKVDCQPIIDQIAMSEVALPYEVVNYWGHPKDIVVPKVAAEYSHTFAVEKLTPMYLVIEPAGVNGNWHAKFNGHKIEPAEFKTREFYGLTNRAVDITALVKLGENTVEFFIKTEKSYDGIVSPCYIFGDFGLIIKDGLQTATARATQGRVGDMATNGLPFYAGDIKYEMAMNVDKSKVADLTEIKIDELYFEDVAELVLNGTNLGKQAWSPYAWTAGKELFRDGANQIELTVTNTLIGLFEGQKFDHVQHRYVNLMPGP